MPLPTHGEIEALDDHDLAKLYRRQYEQAKELGSYLMKRGYEIDLTIREITALSKTHCVVAQVIEAEIYKKDKL